eukprot:CAMPEP_0115739952 /NCGR_PEP_ID=MMETSP0272-20121206/89228_1 /TAXON_ID=71861 /ORGANISM="Scrippsiella trochoidea, Strain CCMP3099" /LENGTH=128 /DNA_ID=CAMNT_0003184561 /DNA_START=419 /DNA_END=803 /DNA_ORIENTATION=-
MTLQAKGAAVVCHAEGVMSLAFLRCRRPHRADLQSQRCRRWCLVLRRGAPDLLRFLHVSGQRAELHKVDEKVHNVLIDRQPQGQATQVDTVLGTSAATSPPPSDQSANGATSSICKQSKSAWFGLGLR